MYIVHVLIADIMIFLERQLKPHYSETVADWTGIYSRFHFPKCVLGTERAQTILRAKSGMRPLGADQFVQTHKHTATALSLFNFGYYVTLTPTSLYLSVLLCLNLYQMCVG